MVLVVALMLDVSEGMKVKNRVAITSQDLREPLRGS
jgi:hypothetical protein